MSASDTANPSPQPVLLASTSSPSSVRLANDVAHILDWLVTPIPEDPARDLAQLGMELAALERAGVDDGHFHRILDLFYDRIQRLGQSLKTRLSGARLPLDKELRAIALSLVGAHERIASGYERLLGDSERLARSQRRNAPTVIARALRCLAEALATCHMAAGPPPANLWRRAHALAKSARGFYEPTATVIPGLPLDAEKIYKGLLALAAAQPEGFTPSEIALAAEYLDHFSASVNLLPAPPADEEAWYWIDTARDRGPLPSSRRIPAKHGELLFCSFRLLARMLGEQIAALEGGTPAGNLRLPESAGAVGALVALKRLQSHWSDPPRRHTARRRNHFHARICIGLDNMRRLLAPEGAPGTAPDQAPRASEWMVTNESPSGFAAMHISGDNEGLLPGSAVALHPGGGKPWNICIVRWMKSENPEHVELGLELVAPTALPVHVLFRSGAQEQQPTPALLLPAVPALRRHRAILAPAGAISARRFFIVSGEDSVRVVQGRVLSTEVQTGVIDVFQFEPDPYPM